MSSLPKIPKPERNRKTPQQWSEHFRAERERWIGREHTKAYRFRNSASRFRVRGW